MLVVISDDDADVLWVLLDVAARNEELPDPARDAAAKVRDQIEEARRPETSLRPVCSRAPKNSAR